MNEPSFRGILATKKDGAFHIEDTRIPQSALPEGEVLIRVAYSSLNYKDGLAVTGRPGVIRKFPMVPGVDLAGTVEESSSPDFQPGDSVVVTGCGTSETLWGGYAQLARLPAECIVPLPAPFDLRQAMAIGTAGFTAMQSVMALEDHRLKPGGRPVVVTGAAGGVGSIAISLLAGLGYTVVAVTGRPELAEHLKALGARDIVPRQEIIDAGKTPLAGERWAGAIDSVGGATLAGLLPAMAIGASVASFGVAGGAEFTSTVFPFILRGVNLLGIDSLRPSNARRRQIWARLGRDLDRRALDSLTSVAPLSKVFEIGSAILAGKVRGRTVIDVNG